MHHQKDITGTAMLAQIVSCHYYTVQTTAVITALFGGHGTAEQKGVGKFARGVFGGRRRWNDSSVLVELRSRITLYF